MYVRNISFGYIGRSGNVRKRKKRKKERKKERERERERERKKERERKGRVIHLFVKALFTIAKI